jgi:hypothetical protein
MAGAKGRGTRSAHLGGLAALLLLACGDSPSSKRADAGSATPTPVCGAESPCGAGLVCALEQCHRACDGDEDCSAREACARSGELSGLCVGIDAPLPPDACVAALCPSERPVCHPSGACVECTSEAHCGGERPVCDRGVGRCAPRSAAPCAPCNAASDCAYAPDGELDCVALEGTFERACLPTCSADHDCPSAFTCRGELCAPRSGSCVSMRAAEARAACETPRDCLALGVDAGAPEAGVCHEGRCALPCSSDFDCPRATSCAAPVCEVDAQEPAGADGGASEPDGGTSGVDGGV